LAKSLKKSRWLAGGGGGLERFVRELPPSGRKNFADEGRNGERELAGPRGKKKRETPVIGKHCGKS